MGLKFCRWFCSFSIRLEMMLSLLKGLASGQIPGLAPIPVPGFAGPQDSPTVAGVNTIPGLSNFNYIIGQLVPQMIPPTNTLLGSSISRLLPKDATKNLAKNMFRAVHPAAENVDVARMMGRWFQVRRRRIWPANLAPQICWQMWIWRLPPRFVT